MKHYLIKNKFTELPSKESVLKLLKATPDSLKLNIGNGGYALPLGRDLPEVEDITVQIEKEFSLPESSAHLYISLSKDADTFGKHRDEMDVYYVHAYGDVSFTVYEEGEHTYKLTAGDMLFLPKHIDHAPSVFSERCGISIG